MPVVGERGPVDQWNRVYFLKNLSSCLYNNSLDIKTFSIMSKLASRRTKSVCYATPYVEVRLTRKLGCLGVGIARFSRGFHKRLSDVTFI